MEMEQDLILEVYSDVYSEVNSKASRERMIRQTEGRQIFRDPQENIRLMRDRKLPLKGVDFRGTRPQEQLLKK